VEPARGVVAKNDGTAALAPMEDRVDVYITFECRGSETDRGFFVNGNRQLSEGASLSLQSSLLLIETTIVEIKTP
jgi:curli biogenesis system outer membrane secretion channel CsgG